MYTTFHLKASDLDERFLKAVKAMFKSRNISIVVEEEQDETEYLLASETNRKMLMESIRQAKKGELVTVDIGKHAKK
ncbi:MAG: hypothetical protein IIA88_01670 [Bacteroidetes bacterium]|nr:hypothetical protein [Bacteroidota bacterium]